MATRPTFQRPDEDDPNAVSSTHNLGGLAGGSSIAGPSTAQAAPPPSNGPSAGSATNRFVSFDRMLDANAGNAQRVADQVVGNVTDKVNSATSALNAGQNAFQERASIMSPQADGTVAYTGPKDITGTSDWENISGRFADATSAVNALGNRRNGGVNAILGTNAGTGSGRLTGALANAKGGERFDALFKNWTTGQNNIMDDTQQAIARTGSMADAANTQATMLNVKKAEQDRIAAEEAAKEEEKRKQEEAMNNAISGVEDFRNRFFPRPQTPTGNRSGDNHGNPIATPGTMPDPKENKGRKKVNDFFRSIIPN